ncbi:hypothetical protein EGW08_002639 [Elysia chlorotica]|uniref:G-protein coupled receptors family 1 profile domain-containing protein n=1 Tax=Elysia chlorotica TaxID=188477 RepID=A0A3S1BR92_ELYCH|nr:hypothetical protein EGW08_002639 [Elysia chlorotica]
MMRESTISSLTLDINVSNVVIVAGTRTPAPSAPPGLLSNELFAPLMTTTLLVGIVFSVLGTGANIVTITVYRRLGFADTSNISLTALAVSDVFVSITSLISELALLLLISSIPGIPFTYEIFVPISASAHVCFSRVSALITAYLSTERYLCVLLPLKIKSLITPKRTFAVMVVLFVAGFIRWPSDFITFPIRWRHFPSQNRTLLGALAATDRTALTLRVFNQIYYVFLLPPLTFSVVVVCTILLSISLHRSRVWRDANKSVNTASLTDKAHPQQSKEAKAVKMVITIATVFIIATIPSSIHLIAVNIAPGFDVGGRYVKIWAFTGAIYNIVDCMNCGANVIIYLNMSSKFRQATLELFSRKGRKK